MNSKYDDLYIYAHRDAKGVNQFYPGTGIRLFDVLTEMTSSGTLTTSWANITGKPNFATVATTGSFNDLTNKPEDTNSFTHDLVCTGNRYHDGGGFEYAIVDLSSFDVSANNSAFLSVASTGVQLWYDALTASVYNVLGISTSFKFGLVFNEPVTGDTYATITHQDIRILSQRDILLQAKIGTDVNGNIQNLDATSFGPAEDLPDVPLNATTGTGEIRLTYRKFHDYVEIPKGKTELILNNSGINLIFDKEGVSSNNNNLKINGSAGTTGQALISQGPNNAPIWGTPTTPSQQQVDWNSTTGITSILNKPTLATVATSGNYNDLINKPTIAGQINADWNATSGSAQILNKPTIPAAQVNSDWNSTSGISQVLNKPTFNYTTTEADTKTLWIDGKSIWKITVQFTAGEFSGATLNKNITSSISGTISDIVDINVLYKGANDYYKDFGTSSVRMNKVTKILTISLQFGLDGVATIYYTK